MTLLLIPFSRNKKYQKYVCFLIINQNTSVLKVVASDGDKGVSNGLTFTIINGKKVIFHATAYKYF